jgi:hypothetical protein
MKLYENLKNIDFEFMIKAKEKKNNFHTKKLNTKDLCLPY